MHQRGIAFLLLLTLLVFADRRWACAQDQPTNSAIMVKSKLGDFTVKMPAPTKHEFKTYQRQDKTLPIYSATADPSDHLACVCSVVQIGEVPDEKKQAELLKEVIKNIVGSKGKVLSDKSELDEQLNVRVRKGTLNNGDDTFVRFKFFIKSDSLYQVFALSETVKNLTAPEVNQFFDSFRLTGDLPIWPADKSSVDIGPFIANANELTDEQLIAYGKRVEQAFASRNSAIVRKVVGIGVDPQLVFEEFRMLGVDLNRTNQDGFITGMSKPGQTFIDNMLKAFKPDDRLKFLFLKRREGKPTLLVFRLIGDGANYYEVEPMVNEQMHVVWRDLFIYLSGELASQSIANATAPAFKNLSKVKKANAESVERYVDFVKKASSGSLNDAMAAYAKLTAEQTKTQMVRRLRIVLFTRHDDPRAEEEVASYERDFPNDASFALASIDVHLSKKRYDRCLKELDRLQASVGDDAYIHFLRHNVYQVTNEQDKALGAIEKAYAIESDFDLFANHAFLAQIQAKDFPKAIIRLESLLKADPGITINDVEADARVKPLLESKEYKAWRAEFAKQAAKE